MNENKWNLRGKTQDVLLLFFVFFPTNHLLPLFFIQLYPNFLEFDYNDRKFPTAFLWPKKEMKVKK